MGQAKQRGSYIERLVQAQQRKVANFGLQAKSLEDIAIEADVPLSSIGVGYLIYFTEDKKFLAKYATVDSMEQTDLPAYAKVFSEFEEVIAFAFKINQFKKVAISYLFDSDNNKQQYVVDVISFDY